MRTDFAIFIITHNRPNKQSTLDLILNSGYTGLYWLVVDDEDCVDEYRSKYGDNVLVFNKQQYVHTTDIGSRRTTSCATFARNAVETFSKQFNYKYFALIDDDIVSFRHRYDDSGSLKSLKITSNFDSIVDAYIEMLDTGISTLSFGIPKLYIGGLSYDTLHLLRDCYTIFFRNTKYDVEWVSAVYEDIITSSLCGKTGQVWLQLPFVQIDNAIMVELEGGNSSMYKSFTQFEYPFHSVMYLPSTMSIEYKKDKFLGIIHRQNNCPMIVSDKYKIKEVEK